MGAEDDDDEGVSREAFFDDDDGPESEARFSFSGCSAFSNMAAGERGTEEEVVAMWAADGGVAVVGEAPSVDVTTWGGVTSVVVDAVVAVAS